MHISLSAINDIDIRDTINDLIKYNLLYIYYQKEKLSLFNHYKYLLQSLKSYIDCYVIFTNGVGLWHPQRVSYFYKVIDDLPQNIIYGRIPYYYENGGYNLSDKGKIICREKHFGEYIEYICKINIFTYSAIVYY